MAKIVKKGIVNVVLSNDGLVYIRLAGRLGEKEVKEFIDKKVAVLKKIKGKTRSFCDMKDLVMADFSMATRIKKLMVKELKELEQAKVERMALLGSSMLLKTIGFFVGKALGIKEVKYFTNRDKAMEWLKDGF